MNIETQRVLIYRKKYTGKKDEIKTKNKTRRVSYRLMASLFTEVGVLIFKLLRCTYHISKASKGDCLDLDFKINYFTRKDYEIFLPFMSQNDLLKSLTENITPIRKGHAQRKACQWRMHLSRSIKVLRS